MPHIHLHGPHDAPPQLAQIPADLLAAFEQRELAKGFLLSTPSRLSNQVFIVQSGRMRVYLAGENRELTLTFLDPGDIYATHTPTYVQAARPTQLYVMEAAVFARQLATSPTIPPVMMRVLGRLLVNAVGLIEDLAFREVPARLARFLLGLAKRRGRVHEQGCVVPFDLGMEDLASLLGTTRQSVSSLINLWERQGILQRQGRHSLLLCSLSALAERCPDPGA